VTIARALSNTFAGIAPSGVVAFTAAQFTGMLAAVALTPLLWPADRPQAACSASAASAGSSDRATSSCSRSNRP
jgi:hypothetical protein